MARRCRWVATAPSAGPTDCARSARTDVVQATVLYGHGQGGGDTGQGRGRRRFEVRSLGLLDRHDVKGAVLLLDTGQVMATERTEEWLV